MFPTPQYLFIVLIRKQNNYKMKHARHYGRQALVGIAVNQAKIKGVLNTGLNKQKSGIRIYNIWIKNSRQGSN